jgi:hypothetical protein
MIKRIPREIVIDESRPNELIISNTNKDLSISDYFAIIFIGLGYWFCIYFFFFFFPPQFRWFSFIFVLIVFIFNTRLMMSFVISIKEKQSIIILPDSIEIIKDRPFLSRHYKLYKSSIYKIDLEEFGFFSFRFPSAILGFKYELNLKYYKAPRIVADDADYYIFEHFRVEVRKWVVEYLNSKIK